jgi:hypothetical protein
MHDCTGIAQVTGEISREKQSIQAHTTSSKQLNNLIQSLHLLVNHLQSWPAMAELKGQASTTLYDMASKPFDIASHF